MRRFLPAFGVLILGLAACASAKTRARFTPESVARIHAGLTPYEVAELFGDPTEVEPFTERGMAGQKYVYKVGRRAMERNVFYFEMRSGTPRLSRWTLAVRE